MAVRRLLRTLAVCAALTCCTSPGLVPVPGTDARSPRAERTYAYGPHARQRVAVHWHPERSADRTRRPAVVVLHGGFWRLDAAPGWRGWCRTLADRGLVVFDVEYRRNLDARWPAQRDDVLSALAWIRQRGERFGVDPERLVLLGSSAGGHLATSVGAYGAGARRVAGVAALSPVVDPLRSWRTGAAYGAGAGHGAPVRPTPRAREEREVRGGPDGDRTARPTPPDARTPPARADRPAYAARVRAARQRGVRENAALLAGCRPARGDGERAAACAEVWRDMSAAAHASGKDDAPLLLVHSAWDFVPAAHSRELARAERARGMPRRSVTVRTVPGAAHGGGLLRAPGVLPALLAWLDARVDAGADGAADGRDR